MAMVMDSAQAHSHLLNPLMGPTPSDETGLGTHFHSTLAPRPASNSRPSQFDNADISTKMPLRKQVPTSSQQARTTRHRSVSQPQHMSRTLASGSTAGGAYHDNFPPQRGASSSKQPSSNMSDAPVRRAASLSARPLDSIRQDHKSANRAPHLRKRHLPGPDLIDRLDIGPGGQYHHEGPYDATLIARNLSWKHSPMAAVQDSNAEALKATPRENIIDAVEKHRPLDGVAAIAPGHRDQFGRMYDYEEGSNMMIDAGGNYKRWLGVEYHPDDIDGKGEPSFTIERALKEHKRQGDLGGGRRSSIELQEHQPSGAWAKTSAYDEEEVQPKRHSKRHSLDGIKRRIGSIRRRKDQPSP
ncbi:hypothetical protein EJ06DRAFT_527343 [Trichodelitschia bisporula]|uniref:Pal1-domain-containing protein n=1 Tax=Trichodelitschia bisporula TaxID=703511 RepID=A0A6G1I610_9PEZI|nr:hypothetical protein EJ06DRAFT_527343 [Trichodelitschia bisporula]